MDQALHAKVDKLIKDTNDLKLAVNDRLAQQELKSVEQDHKLDKRIIKLEIKSGVWGLLGGLLPAIGIFLMTSVKTITKNNNSPEPIKKERIID